MLVSSSISNHGLVSLWRVTIVAFVLLQEIHLILYSGMFLPNKQFIAILIFRVIFAYTYMHLEEFDKRMKKDVFIIVVVILLIIKWGLGF